MKRKPRIEIKIVTDEGAFEYRHAKGEKLKDGSLSAGPSPDDFAKATTLILTLVGVLPLKESP